MRASRCPICSEHLIASSKISATPCGHLFHHMCLARWMECRETCPQCRSQVTANSLIPKLYFDSGTDLEPGEEFDILRVKIADLETELATSRCRIDDLETELAPALDELTATQCRNTDLENQLAVTGNRLDNQFCTNQSLQRLNFTATKQLREEKELTETLNIQLKKKEDECARIIKRWGKDITWFRRKLQDCESLYAMARAEVDLKHQQIEEFKELLRKKEFENFNLRHIADKRQVLTQHRNTKKLKNCKIGRKTNNERMGNRKSQSACSDNSQQAAIFNFEFVNCRTKLMNQGKKWWFSKNSCELGSPGSPGSARTRNIASPAKMLSCIFSMCLLYCAAMSSPKMLSHLDFEKKGKFVPKSIVETNTESVSAPQNCHQQFCKTSKFCIHCDIMGA